MTGILQGCRCKRWKPIAHLEGHPGTQEAGLRRLGESRLELSWLSSGQWAWGALHPNTAFFWLLRCSCRSALIPLWEFGQHMKTWNKLLFLLGTTLTAAACAHKCASIPSTPHAGHCPQRLARGLLVPRGNGCLSAGQLHARRMCKATSCWEFFQTSGRSVFLAWGDLRPHKR